MQRIVASSIAKKFCKAIGWRPIKYSDYHALASELESTKRELETTKRLLLPKALSSLGVSEPGVEPKAHPVTQIFISATNSEPGDLLRNCIKSVKSCFPASDYTIYGNSEAEEFIASYFDPELLAVYRSLRPFAYKADLARLCILYILGGWYIDVGVTWIAPFFIPGEFNLFVLRDRGRLCKSSWSCNNAIIFAKKRHPVILHGIEAIRENFKNRYYGATPLCPTGPNLWGRAVAAMAEPETTLFADVCELTPFHPCKNLAYVSNKGEIFAFAKPSSGGDGLAVFGESSPNSYSELWHQRAIYKDSD